MQILGYVANARDEQQSMVAGSKVLETWGLGDAACGFWRFQNRRFHVHAVKGFKVAVSSEGLDSSKIEIDGSVFWGF